jgi:hypothetical protein
MQPTWQPELASPLVKRGVYAARRKNARGAVQKTDAQFMLETMTFWLSWGGRYDDVDRRP